MLRRPLGFEPRVPPTAGRPRPRWRAGNEPTGRGFGPSHIASRTHTNLGPQGQGHGPSLHRDRTYLTCHSDIVGQSSQAISVTYRRRLKKPAYQTAAVCSPCITAHAGLSDRNGLDGAGGTPKSAKPWRRKDPLQPSSRSLLDFAQSSPPPWRRGGHFAQEELAVRSLW